MAKPNGVASKTFDLWVSAIDPNKQWLKAEIVDRFAVRIWCKLCTKHAERLKGFHNWSDAFTKCRHIGGRHEKEYRHEASCIICPPESRGAGKRTAAICRYFCQDTYW